MIADGLFERFPCDEVYALHNQPSGPHGRVSLNPGAAMAAADFFDIHVTGRGAHGAQRSGPSTRWWWRRRWPRRSRPW
jgi:hippurate hydrolase